MITVVYPLTTQIDHSELKYSLRSIEKFLCPPFEVVIVSNHPPEWINNLTVIELPDVPGQPQYSVRRKIIAAMNYTSEIFFMNDDIFLLEKSDPKNYPYYSSGSLLKVGDSGAKPLLKQLTDLGKPVKYFGHYPSVYKKDFVEALSNFSVDCITKSAYLNFLEVETVEIPDCKLGAARKPDYIREFIKGKPCFSTGMLSIGWALTVLQELYPVPSQYEI